MIPDRVRPGRRPEPLLWGGVVGPALFVAVFVVDGAMRAGYDPLLTPEPEGELA